MKKHAQGLFLLFSLYPFWVGDAQETRQKYTNRRPFSTVPALVEELTRQCEIEIERLNATIENFKRNNHCLQDSLNGRLRK